jgi:hypothetical protein
MSTYDPNGMDEMKKCFRFDFTKSNTQANWTTILYGKNYYEYTL